MLERMRLERMEAPSGTVPFGVRLTPGTAASTADALRERRQAWLERPDGLAATALFDDLEQTRPEPEVPTPQFLNRDDRRSLDDKLERIAPAASRR